jgi:ribosomal protein S14
MNQHDVAQVCKNGHVITSMSQTNPHDKKKRCPRCGAKTTTICRWCKTEIRGRNIGGPNLLMSFKAANRCSNCGMPYPWSSFYKILNIIIAFITLVMLFCLYIVSSILYIRIFAILLSIVISIYLLTRKTDYRIPKTSISVIGFIGSSCGILRFFGIDFSIFVEILNKITK